MEVSGQGPAPTVWPDPCVVKPCDLRQDARGALSPVWPIACQLAGGNWIGCSSGATPEHASSEAGGRRDGLNASPFQLVMSRVDGE